MKRQFWLNLPVKDIKRSRAFFSALGFKFIEGPGNTDTSIGLSMGDNNVIVMLFEESTFQKFTGQEIPDTTRSSEVLLSLDAGSKEEVDELARKAVENGGKSSHKPYTMDGWMYGCVFSDLDGHNWNILYMDHSRVG